MSDDLFFEDEPVEEPKKPAAKSKKSGSAKGSSGTSAKGSAKKAPAKKAPAKQSGFEFTSVVVFLIAVIALLIGFLAGMLTANVFLTPTTTGAPPTQQQQPGGMGGGMGGMGGMDAPFLDDDQMMGEMPPGHPPLDEMDIEGMMDEMGIGEDGEAIEAPENADE